MNEWTGNLVNEGTKERTSEILNVGMKDDCTIEWGSD